MEGKPVLEEEGFEVVEGGREGGREEGGGRDGGTERGKGGIRKGRAEKEVKNKETAAAANDGSGNGRGSVVDSGGQLR
mgnify:CR=1 FL=1